MVANAQSAGKFATSSMIGMVVNVPDAERK
jgi:hypothetical protein